MNWDAVGAIGEIVSAIGVIASLLYLATQIRIQNNESKSRAIAEISTQWNTILGDVASNHDLAVEGFHQQWLVKNLNNETWEALDNSSKDMCQSPGVQVWWENRKHYYSKRFQEYINGNVALARPPSLFPTQQRENVQGDT